MGKIILKNAVKRKVGWLYYIDIDGNLCGYDLKKRLKEIGTYYGTVKPERRKPPKRWKL